MPKNHSCAENMTLKIFFKNMHKQEYHGLSLFPKFLNTEVLKCYLFWSGILYYHYLSSCKGYVSVLDWLSHPKHPIKRHWTLYAVSHCKVNYITLFDPSHKTTVEKHSLAAIGRVFFSIFFLYCAAHVRPYDCDAAGECACYRKPWPSWQGGKQITISTVLLGPRSWLQSCYYLC